MTNVQLGQNTYFSNMSQSLQQWFNRFRISSSCATAMKTMQKTGKPSETGKKSVVVFILQRVSLACSSLGPYTGFRIARTGEKMTKK